MISSFRKIVFFSFLLLVPSLSWGIEVAITVDDLPGRGAEMKSANWVDIVEKMVAVFKKHKIQGVYGFVNAKPLSELDSRSIELKKVLSHWVNAGHFLGNHTFGHSDLDQVEASEYIKDIKSNEPTLLNLMMDRNFKYFRYPFLAEGDTQRKRDEVRNFLFTSGYNLAPVTMDFFDYEWADPYFRCTQKNDLKAVKWLRESYVEQAGYGMEIAHLLSQMLFGRDIKYVLLIHIGSIQAEVLDSLLTTFETKHVNFIALPDALSDSSYQIDPKVARKRSYTFLNQIRLSRGLPNPKRVSELYELLPEAKLESICK